MFLSRDPALSGNNWFGYVRNNPIEWLDPTGEYQDPQQKGPPNFPVPWGKPGDEWKWVLSKPVPGSKKKPGRPGKWVPKGKVKVPGGKGGQPGASWDENTPGTQHWDVDLGNGQRTGRAEDGRPVGHDEAHGRRRNPLTRLPEYNPNQQGLQSAAVFSALYWIISEGSRVIWFRNLLPLP